MAERKILPPLLLLLLLSISLVIPVARGEEEEVAADAVLETDKEAPPPPPTHSDLLPREVEQLKSKISALELSIENQNKEIERKDKSLLEVEKIIKEKSNAVSSLQKEIETIQKKKALDAAELLEQAHARSATLEKQIEKLNGEILMQGRTRDSLEARASEAEKKIEEITSKLNTLQRSSDEQRRNIKKTERLLKVAEEELLKAKSEAASKKKELAQIHGAWLPTWLAMHLEHYVEYTTTQWKHNAKPALDALLQKAFEVSAQAQKYAEPHMNMVKEKWLPALEEQWITFSATLEPHLQHVYTKTLEYYQVFFTKLRPHVVRAQELANPYFQKTRKFSKPYIDQMASVTKPHVERIRIALKPYTKKAVRTYGKFLKSATTYHHQVQVVAQDKLKKYELTKALATKELVWFLASAFLAFPIYLIYLISASFFCKKPRKRTQISSENSTPRRHKRRHAEK